MASMHLRLVAGKKVDELEQSGQIARDLSIVGHVQRIPLGDLFNLCKTLPVNQQNEGYFEFVRLNTNLFRKYFEVAEVSGDISGQQELVNYLQMLTYFCAVLDRYLGSWPENKANYYKNVFNELVIKSGISEIVDRLISQSALFDNRNKPESEKKLDLEKIIGETLDQVQHSRRAV